MKAKNFLLCALLLGGLSVYGQVKIGDNPQNIDLASLLELESTDKALVLSRVTTAEMNAIVPLEGAIVFNTDIACLFYYEGTQWINLCEELPLEFTTDAIVNTAETMVITLNGDAVNFEVGEISSENIVDFSIGGIDIQNNAVTADKLAPNSVGSEELQDNTITDLEMDYTEVTLADFTNDAGFITGANIISADAGNNITAGTDGGAYFNAEPFEIAINNLQDDLDLKEDVANKSTDVTLGNSDILYPSQNAVKTYVDNVVGGSAQTIVSTDGGNSITAGGDGGAFLNITPLQNQVTTVQNDLATHVGADADLSATNEQITSIVLNGNDLEITEGGVVITGDLSALAGAGAQNLAGVLATGNDGGAAQIKNILDPTDPQDAATKAYVDAEIAGVGGGGTQDLNSVLTQGSDAGAQQINNLADPTLDQDAATKAYVDAVAGGGAVEVADQVTIVGVGSMGDPFRVADGGIDTDQLADDAVTGPKILDGTIVTADIADNSVTIEKILNGAPGQVLTSDAMGDVIWAAPSAGTVASDATLIGDGTAGNELGLADDAVTTAKILDGEVQTDDLADENVTPAKIEAGAAGEVLTTDGAGDVVWAAPTAGAVGTDATLIGDGTVGNELGLADDAVTTAKILDGEVQTDDIADNNVTVDKIAEGTDGQVLTTDGAGDVIWDTLNADEVAFDGLTSSLTATDVQGAIDEVVANLGATGDPNGVFFADAGTGAPITDEPGFSWNPALRFNTGGLGIGLDGDPHGDLTKVHIREQVTGIAYPLMLQNDNTANGNTVGLLFSVSATTPTPYAKGAIVFERVDGFGDGSIHFLQNTGNVLSGPTLNDAKFTVTYQGDAGIGTRTPNAKLEVEGETLTESLENEGFYTDENGVTGTPGQVLTATATGTAWAAAGGGGTVNVDGTTITGDGDGTPLAVGTISGGPGGQIAANSITQGDIDTDAIGSGEIIDDAVGESEIQDAAVTPAKIEPSLNDGDVLTTTGGAVVWAAPATSAVSVWGKVNGNSNALTKGNGISGITSAGNGQFTINFTAALADSNYTVQLSATGDYRIYVVVQTNNSMDIEVRNNITDALEDPSFFFVSIIE
ncbi:hypothetical protein SAMN04490243_0402 [Robiginitalea myxolifaciens]|uniref:Collagen triple helix repeat-containing protein n=1 Tax=Robiginitalea myxolifaciens TaxID=400055 RepID=A0A1I6FPW3_9FLAO|nr:hypothetical protein [Robiginitalea myxolifaciens]SFR31985.1 hypothetical protein SAMN04490243_0402 [Robiginitalea myxolifaciens]